ncbi:hypothetical protein lbkm_2807 [Lachnospiraceae bacterium KM106-2]|nr:hypothetical protein lbkm_2807 [Lachnospiraceae bacterium KM106-2]
MELNCYLEGIVNIQHPNQGIHDLLEAGFHNILFDLSKFYDKKEEQLSSQKANDLAVKLKEKGITISIAQAPYTQQKELLEKAIKLCNRMECKSLVVMPLDGNIGSQETWEKNKNFYLQLIEVARKYQVKILLNNQYRDQNSHLVRGVCSDGSEAAAWIDRLNQEAGEERFGFCMDVGICNLCGQSMYEFTLELGKRLEAVVLRDCDGNKENAMLPFTCVNQGQSQTDWLSMIRGLRKIEFDGHLIMNLKDTAIAFSPLLRPQLFKMAKSIGDYFSWQIGMERLIKSYPSIVLFGAGNMCRNYMKCYADWNPPLFTCDNNEVRWGTEFCGLEVRSPESLMKIPENCAIFICNIYYREIEKQLREMGVRNPIEFFNDEYMPTYYFERLEGGK